MNAGVGLVLWGTATPRAAGCAMGRAVDALDRVRAALPRGNTLTDATWQSRHQAINMLLWFHVAALPFIGWWQGRHSSTRSRSP